MNTKLENRLALIPVIGFILWMGCFFITPTALRFIMVHVAIFLIGAGAASTTLCFHVFGKHLTFDDLRKGRVKVLDSYQFSILKISDVKNETNYRHLGVSSSFPARALSKGTIIEIGEFKAKEFKNLDKSMFFLEGNTVLHIVTAEELAHEESALKCGTIKDHS